ncbi:MAG: hypothetical protein UHD09_04020 [Bifidobacterium sp.]|nr:hypothetical protein [Bifidobacterium sp.]
MASEKQKSTERFDRYGNVKERGANRGRWVVALLVVGYVLLAPLLLTMVDSPANTAINDWLRGGAGPIAAIVVGSVLGWACWIAAAVMSRRPANAGRVGGWRAVARPVVTIVTVLCAFCTVFALPLLCIAHAG